MNRRGFLQLVGAALLGGVWTTARAATPEPRAEEIVREAIVRQRMLRLSYRGHPRLVEPHAFGTTAGGNRALLAWQVEGGSQSNPPTGWRLFTLAQIEQPALTVRGFAPRASYHRESLAALRTVELDVRSGAPSESPAAPTRR